MNKKVLSITTALLLLVLVLASCTPAGSAEYVRISAQQAKEIMDTQSGYIILDVRTKDEYNQGHIPNAVLLPNESIGTSPPVGVLPDYNQMILVYCRSGNRSRQASEKLAKMGYTNVHEFGGISSWPYEIGLD